MIFGLATYPIFHPANTRLGLDIASNFLPEEVDFVTSLANPTSLIEMGYESILGKLPGLNKPLAAKTVENVSNFAIKKGQVSEETLNGDLASYGPFGYPYVHSKIFLRNLFRRLKPDNIDTSKAGEIADAIKQLAIKHEVIKDTTQNSVYLSSLKQNAKKSIEKLSPASTPKSTQKGITRAQLAAHIAAPITLSAINWMVLRYSWINTINLRSENIPFYATIAFTYWYWNRYGQPAALKIQEEIKEHAEKPDEASDKNDDPKPLPTNENSDGSFARIFKHITFCGVGAVATYKTLSLLSNGNLFSYVTLDLSNHEYLGYITEGLAYITGVSDFDWVRSTVAVGAAATFILNTGEFAKLRKPIWQKFSNEVLSFSNEEEAKSQTVPNSSPLQPLPTTKSYKEIFNEWKANTNKKKIWPSLGIGAAGATLFYYSSQWLPVPSLIDVLAFGIYSHLLLPKKKIELAEFPLGRTETSKVQQDVLKTLESLQSSITITKTNLEKFKEDLPGVINLTPFNQVRAKKEEGMLLSGMKGSWNYFFGPDEKKDEKAKEGSKGSKGLKANSPEKKEQNQPVALISKEFSLPGDISIDPVGLLGLSYKSKEEAEAEANRLNNLRGNVKPLKPDAKWYFLTAQYNSILAWIRQQKDYQSTNTITQPLKNQIASTVEYFKLRGADNSVIKNYLEKMQKKAAKIKEGTLYVKQEVLEKIKELMPKESKEELATILQDDEL